MNRYSPKSVTLGDLIAAVFEEAAQHSPDTQEVSLLATLTVMNLYLRLSRANGFMRENGNGIYRERSSNDSAAG